MCVRLCVNNNMCLYELRNTNKPYIELNTLLNTNTKCRIKCFFKFEF